MKINTTHLHHVFRILSKRQQIKFYWPNRLTPIDKEWQLHRYNIIVCYHKATTTKSIAFVCTYAQSPIDIGVCEVCQDNNPCPH